MKRLWKIAGIATIAAIVVAVLGIAAVGVAAFAQGDTDTTGSTFDYVTKFKEALAGILGISVDEYDAAVDKAEQQVIDQAVSEGRLTEEQAQELQSRLDRAVTGAGLGKAFGKMDKGMGHISGVSLRSVAAEKLGMELEDLLTELENGKTIAALAEEKGVDTQTIVDAYLAQVKEKLDEKVAGGDITQEQADLQLEQAKTRATEKLTGTWEGPEHRGGRHSDMTDSGTDGL